MSSSERIVTNYREQLQTLTKEFTIFCDLAQSRRIFISATNSFKILRSVNQEMNAVMTDFAWDLAHPFTTSIVVGPEDIDRLGHTNNQVYLRWMEDLSWRHVDQLEFGWEAYQRFQRALAIRRTEIDYLSACYAGDELILGTWITGCDGRLLSERQFQLMRVEDGRTVLRAKITYVCIDLANGKPRRMPPEFVEFHERAMAQWQPK